MSTTKIASVLSGRAQDRLSQLQRSLAAEFRTLNSHQSLLFGALQACDLSTQNAHLQEYFGSVNAVFAAVTRLRAFLDRYADDVADAQNANLLEHQRPFEG